ncbi:toll/interleukin-1 receptor domain-containing protein [Microvirga vignae]|uniref:toll/interleukin-1 receptor domain-containing protein n=1 Tax=Microvirga vignae TaxID=1225564 RepID=UPI000699A52F|nr:toll/interleukin-1 receptor domain-containing protein [Microvirga vignae]
MADIFISYAREDRDRIIPFVRLLEAQGWTVWWDRKIPVGKTFEQVIKEQLATARCVIVVWSTEALGSGWVIDEAGEGRKRDILLPVLFDRVEPPFGFRQLQSANLSDWHGQADHPECQQLIADISGLLGGGSKSSYPLPEPRAEDYYTSMDDDNYSIVMSMLPLITAFITFLLISIVALIIASQADISDDSLVVLVSLIGFALNILSFVLTWALRHRLDQFRPGLMSIWVNFNIIFFAFLAMLHNLGTDSQVMRTVFILIGFHSMLSVAILYLVTRLGRGTVPN